MSIYNTPYKTKIGHIISRVLNLRFQSNNSQKLRMLKSGYMVFGLFASSAGFRQLTTLYKAHHKKNAAAMPGGYIFLRFGVAFAYSLCVTKKPSSWEYIFQPSTFLSRLKKYTPTCFGVPLVGLGAPSCLVRLHSVPAFF